jgi:hypothetical protein
MKPADFINALQQQGVTVERAEQMPRSSFPFFSVNAERLLVNGESVHAFAYPDVSSAAQDARLVPSAGTPIGATQISWVATPHFFTHSSIIVLYVGTSSEVTRALTAVLGPPFAGGL